MRSPRSVIVQTHQLITGAAASLANWWVYTASGWQKPTPPSVYDGAWKTVQKAWVYTASGWQQIYGAV